MYITAPSTMMGLSEEPPGRGTEWRWPANGLSGRFGLFLLTLCVYAAGSQIALQLIEISGLSGVFFIPAGITVAFLLRLPRHLWWIVLLAAGMAEAVMDLASGLPADATIGFVAANVVEPLVGALVVGRLVNHLDLSRLRHVWAFFVGAVITGPIVGAILGAGSDRLLGGDDFVTTFLQWWLGDALGVVVVGSAILVWGSSPDRRSMVSGPGSLLLGGTIGILGILTVSDLPLQFLVVIALVVAGALFGPRAVAVTSLLAAAGVAMELVLDIGILMTGVPDYSALIVIKLQLGVFTLTGLVLGAEAQERELAVARSLEADSEARLADADRHIEHRIAVRLQRALLPEMPIRHPLISVAARYEAGSEAMVVGGDWYDVFDLPGDRIGITVGDVVGHGLEASATMGRMRTAIAALARTTESPAEVLAFLDDFAAGPSGSEFATACYAILDPATGMLTHSSAGHPPLLVIDSSGATRWLMGGRSAPIYGAPVARSESQDLIEPGSTILAYSDGLFERRGEDLQVGMARLEAALRRSHGEAPKDVCAQVLMAMQTSDYWLDDVVVLAVRYETSRSDVGGDEPGGEELDEAADLKEETKPLGEDDGQTDAVVDEALMGRHQ